MVKVSLKQQMAFQVLLWDLVTVAVDVPIRNSTHYQMGLLVTGWFIKQWVLLVIRWFIKHHENFSDVYSLDINKV